MKKIMQYEMNEYVPEWKLLKNGFKKKSDRSYVLVKNLYRNIVKLVLIIDTEEGYVSDNVENDLGYPYPPFYNLKYGGDNNVRDEVIKNYNRCISSLIKKNILNPIEDNLNDEEEE